MKLVSASASPFVRKVCVLLHETGQTDDVEMVAVKTSPVATAPDARDANPLGKIPALIREDGRPIFDSRVICRYLDARAKGGLYPEDRLWDVLTLEAMADGIMDAAVLITYEGRLRAPEQQDSTWLDAQWAKVTQALDSIEKDWRDDLNAPRNMGQFALGCALGYLDFRHAARNWRDGRPVLADWFETVSNLESMQSTAPRD
ncbi:glutathione S-transferase N-terminal domain-containing protein [Shimia aestuarii]|uniref:glutathione S-transferase N-terminal domain-containing protein n=1 Tax=Shimia aestuarii TaxID=254406 RepID=UPI001FB3D6D4|nr:glutathione S-transferase N-terminal domain-containing protein [Shimia aestuarii]